MTQSDSFRERQNLKVKRISASDQAAEKMKEFVLTGEWIENEKIPSESDLSEMFGVNRLTVRMALQKLNTLGIIDTRAGEGSFVRNFSLRKYIDEASQFFTRPEMMDDVCDYRKLIEIECAVMAMTRATEEEFETLRELGLHFRYLSSQMDNEPNLDDDLFEQVVQADLDFHYQICKMSHNSLLINSFIMAREPIHQYLHMIVRKRMEANYAIHQMYFIHSNMHMELYESIRNGDQKTCRKIYLDMIDYNVDLN